MKRSIIAFLLFFLSFAAGSLFAGNDDMQRKYDKYFLDAMMWRQQGNTSATFDLLNRCLEIDSTASEAYFYLAIYYSDMNDNDRALAYLEKASQLSPNTPIYLETLAQSYARHQRYADAISVTEKLYEADKSRQELLETLYHLYSREQQYDKAIATLERMEAIDGKSERISLSKSSLYLQTNRQEDALKEMKELSEKYPNDMNYRTLYANTLMMNEQPDEARQVLEGILREEPDNHNAQLSLRSYYITQNDTAKADSLTHSLLFNANTDINDKINLLRQEISHSEQNGGDSTAVLALFHELLSQPAPHPDIAEFCAAYMSLKKMPKDSIGKMFELVLKLAPDNAPARLQLVQYAWDDGDNDRIVELCKAARQYNPEEMAFYYYQGMAFYRQNDHDDAIDAFQNGISVITNESNPAIVSDFYAVLGDLLHQKGKEREAFAAYDSCLQWKPDNVGCLNNYAYYLSEMGRDLDRALAMSEKSVKAEPHNATYLDTYAWILFMQKRYAEARIYIDQAVQNDSTANSVILDHAGDIYALNGDMEAAVEFWQRALADDPQNKMIRKKIKRKKYIK